MPEPLSAETIEELEPTVAHPSVTALEEMFERGWTLDDLCRAIDGTPVTKATLELFFLVRESGMRMGSLCGELDRAFGVSPGLFANLEAAWLADVAKTQEKRSALLAAARRVEELEAFLREHAGTLRLALIMSGDPARFSEPDKSATMKASAALDALLARSEAEGGGR